MTKTSIPQAEQGYPNDVTVTFRGRFVENTRGNVWYGLPKDLSAFLETLEGTMSGITDRMLPEKDYTVTLHISEI